MDKFNLPWLLVVLVVFTFSDVCAFPEKGKWTYDINQDTKFIGVFKSLFSNSTISFNSKFWLSNHNAEISKCIYFCFQFTVANQTNPPSWVSRGVWDIHPAGKNTLDWKMWYVIMITISLKVIKTLFFHRKLGTGTSRVTFTPLMPGGKAWTTQVL